MAVRGVNQLAWSRICSRALWVGSGIPPSSHIGVRNTDVCGNSVTCDLAIFCYRCPTPCPPTLFKRCSNPLCVLRPLRRARPSGPSPLWLSALSPRPPVWPPHMDPHPLSSMVQEERLVKFPVISSRRLVWSVFNCLERWRVSMSSTTAHWTRAESAQKPTPSWFLHMYVTFLSPLHFLPILLFLRAP